MFMKIVHMISGGETGGSRKHVVTLLAKLPQEDTCLIVLQEGALAQEARKAGIRVELFEQTSRYDISVLKRIVSFINQEGFDVLHTHGPRANFFGAWMKKRIRSTWVTTIHSDPKLDFMKTGIKGKLFTKLNLLAINRIDYFFAVSERFKENLVSFGIPAEKIQTIYNGIDFSPVTDKQVGLLEEWNLKETDFIMTMVARLHPVKGHDTVFQALKNLNSPNMKLLLVGDGPIKDELVTMVKTMSLENQVLFLGFRKDIPEIYSISHISLLASHSESFPLSLLEAANEEVPIVSTDVGGVNMLIPDQRFGWVVPIKDATSYQVALDQAYAEHRAGTLSEKGVELRNFAKSKYSLDNLAKLTVETYKRIRLM